MDAAIETEDEPFVNPCNHVLIPFESVQQVCRQMNKVQGDDDSGFSKAKKVSSDLWAIDDKCVVWGLQL